HFRRWNNKLSKIKTLERQVYEEIELGEPMLRIYGETKELDKLKDFIKSEKVDVTIKGEVTDIETEDLYDQE
ncbi:MAG: hypothetical protein ACW99Q_29265, partial [Candidatus Kariarchaeaceae archaeon]